MWCCRECTVSNVPRWPILARQSKSAGDRSSSSSSWMVYAGCIFVAGIHPSRT